MPTKDYPWSNSNFARSCWFKKIRFGLTFKLFMDYKKTHCIDSTINNAKPWSTKLKCFTYDANLCFATIVGDNGRLRVNLCEIERKKQFLFVHEIIQKDKKNAFSAGKKCHVNAV